MRAATWHPQAAIRRPLLASLCLTCYQPRMRTLLHIVLLLVLMAGCSQAPQPVVPLPPGSPLNASALQFLQEAPASIEWFAVVDAGMPMDQLLDEWFSVYGEDTKTFWRAIKDDMRATFVRRLGMPMMDVQSVGVIGWKSETKGAAFFFRANGTPNLPRNKTGRFELDNNLQLMRSGSHWVIAESDALDGLLAAQKRGRMMSAVPTWVPWALTFAKSGILVAGTPNDGKHEAVVMSPSWGETVLAARAMPGQADAVDAEWTGLMDKLKAEATKNVAELMQANKAAGIAARYVQDAVWKSLNKTRTGDDLRVTFALGAPQLPAFAPMPAKVPHIAAGGEWLIAQVTAGGPWLLQLMTLCNVFGDRLDVAAMMNEVGAALPPTIPASAHTFILSMGREPLVSLVGAAPGQSGMLMDDIVVTKQPWGVAMGEKKGFDGARASAGADMPAPIGSPDQILLRVIADVTKAPDDIRAMAEQWVRSVYVESGFSALSVEAVLAPGKGETVMGLWSMGTNAAMESAKAEYNQRAQKSFAEEVGIIYAYHAVAFVVSKLQPTLVGTDRMRIHWQTDMQWTPGMVRAMQLSVITGALAAAAIPAFISYQKRSIDALNQPLTP